MKYSHKRFSFSDLFLNQSSRINLNSYLFDPGEERRGLGGGGVEAACNGGTILKSLYLIQWCPFMLFGPLLKVTLPFLFSLAIQYTSWCKTEW